MTVTPLLCVMFLKAPEQAGQAGADPYGGRFYDGYRRPPARLHPLPLAHRGAWWSAAFAAALWGFGYVDDSFFPDSTRPQFMVDFWLPQGTHIDDTTREVAGGRGVPARA